MGNSNTKDPAPTPDEAIQRLRGMEKLLEKKIEMIEVKIAAEIKQAKKLGIKNKNHAMKCLVRKKSLEKQLQITYNQLGNIESQLVALESAEMNGAILENLKYGGRALTIANNGMTLEEVDDMMDDIQDAKDVADEINEAISRPLANSYDYDEDNLLAELEELEQEELDSRMLDVSPASMGPSLESPISPFDTQTHLRQLENWSSNADSSLDVPVSPTDTVRTQAQMRELVDWMGQ